MPDPWRLSRLGSGWGSVQPDVAVGVSAHCRIVGVDGLWVSIPIKRVL